jgi:myosin heavy subunit
MPRFSLSPAASDDDEEDYVLRKPQNFIIAAQADQADEEDEEEVEPPHPIGFGSPWGKTCWFGLDPPPPRGTGKLESSSSSPGQCRYALDDLDFVYSSDEEEDLHGFHVDTYVQSYPPIASYIRSSTASTPMLMRYHRQCQLKQQQRDDGDDIDDDIVQLSALLYAACVVDNTKPPPQIILPPWSQTSRKIQETMNRERQRLQQEHLEAAQGLKLLLQDAEKQANIILLQRQKEEQEAQDFLQQQQIAQEARDLAEQEAYDAAMAKKEQVQKQKRVAQEEQNTKLIEAKAKEAQKTEYIQKAKKLVADLIPMRQSVEPFETSKSVSKRRLQMKKTVRGKVNTLNEDANKVREVAQEVSQAVSQARSEDEQAKQMLQLNQPNVSKEMARGKRYLVDLLASNAMERVQAESFNGTKGDGFPLAAMLAMISTEQKELVPILAAHIYTVCPIAIPALPTNLEKDATEDALMSSLGMQKDKKTGEYESFPRFLARTEVSAGNIIHTLPRKSASTNSDEQRCLTAPLLSSSIF